ncbi:MAG: protein-disulfide reductase DsbD family protein, partial [Undibacterium sp.]|nr:protein-disulfide reductase DsbD family protein [Undibacterium sp.]
MRWFCRLLAGVFLSLSFWGIAIAEDFLDPEVAFKVDAKMVGVGQLRVTFKVADGYYLYREQFKFEALGAELGLITLPPGKVKFDETFGKDVATFHHGLELVIPVKAAGDFQLKVRQQGCADAGLCYPPMDLVLPV